MVEFQEYASAWLIYFAAVVGLLIVTWRLFLGIKWRYIRGILFFTVLVFLATPVLDTTGYWAPAWIVSALEILFGGVEKVMPVLHIMLMVWGVVLCAYTLVFLLFLRKKTASKKSKIPRRDNETKRANRKVVPRAS